MINYPPNPILIVDDSRQATRAIEILLHKSGLENTSICHDSRKVMKIISEMPVSNPRMMQKRPESTYLSSGEFRHKNLEGFKNLQGLCSENFCLGNKRRTD